MPDIRIETEFDEKVIACANCGILRTPRKSLCPVCGSPKHELVKIKSIVHENYNPKRSIW